MINTILPVILLKKIILLPNNELRLEFDNDISKNILDESLLHHDNKVFVVTQLDGLEEQPDLKDLPLIGITAIIQSRIELPSGKIRVVLVGYKRAIVNDYLKDESINKALISEIDSLVVEEEVNIAMGRKLKKEIENYIKEVPYISNSVISKIEDAKSLDVITDIIVNHLQLSISRKHQYIGCYDPLKRTKMVLEDIYKDEESFAIEKKLDGLVQDEIDKNQKEYILKEKLEIIKKELGDTDLRDNEIFELRKKADALNIDPSIKEKIDYEINRYASLSSSSSELGIVRSYIECMLSLPWNNKTKENTNLSKIKDSLNDTHYGLESVKERIIEYLAVRKNSNNVKSPIICLIGPPGVGKTSLANSIATSLNRKFVKISVGGLSDEAEIRGHRRTYIGAYPGRIIEGLKSAKTNNPVILIDEVDKMESGKNGNPINALLEVLDKSQNEHFHDNYLDIDYDISDIMFILTANDEDSIPYLLRDRLEIIKISEYTEYEKCDIAKKYIVPKLCTEHNLETINIDKPFLMSVIRDYTKEAGVRDLERLLESVIRKVITKAVLKNKKIDIINLKTRDINKYLGISKYKPISCKFNQVGVVSALSYSPYGGEVLPIEVNYYKGKGELILTGSLGKVMQESATIALSYIKANSEYFGIDYEELINNDIHIHVPSGSISKDGPSAGVTLVTSIISAFKNINFVDDIAFTGEITLRGHVLPVGGLKEKCLGAIKNNIKTIFVPIDNKCDIEELEEEIKENIDFIFVSDYKEIYDKLINFNKKKSTKKTSKKEL